MAQRLLILGAGGHGRSVCDIIVLSGHHVVGYLDEALLEGTLVSVFPVLGGLSFGWDLKRFFDASGEAPSDQVVVAIGNPALRQTWLQVLEQVAVPLAVLLHPRGILSAIAQLGPGSVILPGAVVNAHASLHQGVLVNSGAVVDHDAICGAHSQLGANASMAGGSRLGPLACLAAGDVLACGQTHFAALELTPGASDPGEGFTVKP